MFDIYDDVDRSLFKVIEREYEIPRAIKVASLRSDVRESKQIFAYPEENKYPMDTPEDLYTSYLYFQKTAHQLPPYAKTVVEDNLHRHADLLGLSLQAYKKEASMSYDKNDFAVAIPVWDLQDPNLIQKCASMIHNDYMLMYPINTVENVKLANYYFPAGLEGPFEVLRPKVARMIASRLEPDEYSDKLMKYLPVPKSAALEQLEVRKHEYPEFASKYASLERFLDNCSPTNSVKFASELSKLDKQANIFQHVGIVDASEFNKFIYDDGSAPLLVKIANMELAWDDVLEAENSISGVVPDWEFAKGSPKKFASVVNELPEVVQKHILTKIHNHASNEWTDTYLNRNA
jgi:hypothetical protein